MSLGTFTSAKTAGDTFTDSSSNDIIVRTSNINQRLLFGFSSNVNSLMRVGASNVWLGWSNMSFSNLGTFNVTSNATINHTLYSSNVYVGTPNTFTNSNFMFFCSGSTRIEGDLVINGTLTNVNTNVNVTDQFLVNNLGTGPALVVNQDGAQSIADFKQNNTLVMTLANNTFLGIGSNAPQAKLDVQGDSIQRGSITCSNVYASNIGVISITPSNVFMGGNLIIDNTGLVQNSNFIPYLDATKIVRGDSSNYSFSSNFIRDRNIISYKLDSNLSIGGQVFMDGFVNIGYSTSNFTGYRLKVNDGDALVMGSNNFASTANHARLNFGDSNYFISGSKDIGMLFQVSNTTYPMALTASNGFLGLGTVNPTENLHVIGNAKFASNVYILNSLGINTSNAKEVVHLTLGNARMDSNLYVLNALAITSSNPTEKLDVAGANNAKIGSNMYVMNSIGVFTSNPTQRFHIQDGMALVNETRAATRASVYIQYSNLTSFNLQQDSSGVAYMQNNQNTMRILALSNTTISSVDGGSNTERFRINGVGQAGLGHSNPNTNTLLHMRDMNNASNAQLRIENFQGYCMTLGQAPAAGNTYLATECNLNMTFSTNNQERVRITSNALFGFGTSNPQSIMHVYSPSNNYGMTMQIADATNTTGLQVTKMSTQDCAIMNTAPNYLSFGTSNVEQMRIDAQGKTGVGLAAVGDRLEVNGNIRSSTGTIGPMMMLLPPISYTDVPVGSMLVLDNTLEAGNEISSSTWRPLYNSPGFLYNNQSSETMSWTSARLIFRGMSMTLSNNDITTLAVQEFYYNRVPQYSNITPTFTLSNMSRDRGYVTSVTPWFTNQTTDVRHLAIYVQNSTYNSLYRFGSVYIQYRSIYTNTVSFTVTPLTGTAFDVTASNLSSSPVSAWGTVLGQTNSSLRPAWYSTGGGTNDNLPYVMTTFTGSGTYLQNLNSISFPSYSGNGFSFAASYYINSFNNGWDRLLQINYNGEFLALSRNEASTTVGRVLYGGFTQTIPNMYALGTWINLIITYNASTSTLSAYMTDGTTPTYTYTKTNTISSDITINPGNMILGNGGNSGANIKWLSAMLAPYPLTSAQVSSYWSYMTTR